MQQAHKLNFSPEIISIVAQQFSKNPRKIIQFLNVLQTEILLSENQESKTLIPAGSISDNLPFFTKLLIIREEWPDLYQALKSSPYLLGNIYDNTQDKNDKYYLNDYEINTEQRNYLRRTNHIKPNHNNFELFFFNKDSFKDIPDKTNLLVESNDLEGIKELLKNSKLEYDELIKFIDYKFETALKRGEVKTTIVNLVSLILGSAIDTDLKKQTQIFLFNSGKFLGGFRSFITSDSMKSILTSIDDKLLLMFTKEYQSLSKTLLKNIISLINQSEDSKQILIDFVDLFKDDPKILKKVSSKFSEYLSSDNQFTNKVKHILNDKVVIDNLINSELINNYIEKIDNDPENEDSNQKLEIIFLYNEITGLSNEQINKVATKLISFINSVNDLIKTPYWFEKLNLFILNIMKDNTHATNIYNSLNSKQEWLWQQYNSLWNNEDYQKTLKIFLTVVCNFYSENSDTNKDIQLVAWLNQYYNKNESQEMIIFINSLFHNIIDRYDVYQWPFAQNIINRFTQNSDWQTQKEIVKALNLMLEKTTEEEGLNGQQIKTIFTNYINLVNKGNQDEVINWISETLHNNLLQEHFETIIEQQADDKKFQLLKLLNELNKNELVGNIIFTILKDVECDEIENVFERIENAKVNKKIIIKSIKKVLKDIEREDGNFDCLIEFLSKLNYSDKAIHNLIAEKIKNLLATDNNDEILFALGIIDNLKIRDTRKLSVIKTLIQDINESGFEDEDLKFVKKMKKKY